MLAPGWSWEKVYMSALQVGWKESSSATIASKWPYCHSLPQVSDQGEEQGQWQVRSLILLSHWWHSWFVGNLFTLPVFGQLPSHVKAHPLSVSKNVRTAIVRINNSTESPMSADSVADDQPSKSSRSSGPSERAKQDYRLQQAKYARPHIWSFQGVQRQNKELALVVHKLCCRNSIIFAQVIAPPTFRSCQSSMSSAHRVDEKYASSTPSLGHCRVILLCALPHSATKTCTDESWQFWSIWHWPQLMLTFSTA